MVVGRQFRTPHAAFRNQRLTGTCKELGNGKATYNVAKLSEKLCDVEQPGHRYATNCKQLLNNKSATLGVLRNTGSLNRFLKNIKNKPR